MGNVRVHQWVLDMIDLSYNSIYIYYIYVDIIILYIMCIMYIVIIHYVYL